MARTPFSQRVGAVKPRTALQVGDVDMELRTRLWNALDKGIGSIGPGGYEPFVYEVWEDVVVRPLVDLKAAASRWTEMRAVFFDCAWYQVYDIIELAARANGGTPAHYREALERGGSGYRFVGHEVVPIVSETEIVAIEQALQKTATIALQHVRDHLDNALGKFADRTTPDYPNSIKESISAVEALARLVTGSPNATLGDALKRLDDAGITIHPAMRDAFNKLYGYTSDASGIRHAQKLGEDKADADEARFMLVAASAFVNFLIAKAVDAGITFT
jgi:hypothetical protein